MLLKSINSIDVILASQANWRSNILNQLSINHRQFEHRYEEPKYSNGSIETFIEDIAIQKAKSLSQEFNKSMIIAADQLICLDDEILYKSGTRMKAIEQLVKMNGQKHKLICSVAVFFLGVIESDIATAELEMRALHLQEIENYVDADKPWDCAGSYKIESLGASLFKNIAVNDPTTIIGLPSNKLLDIIRKFGFTNLL